MSDTQKVKMRKRRARIRRLLPELEETKVAEAAEIENAVERTGYLILLAHEKGLPVNQIYAYRTEVQACSPEHVSEAQNKFRYLADQKACEANYRMITILRFGLHGITHDLSDEQVRLDDRKHRPAYIDPVLRGPARATGHTAKAVKSRKTYTNWQMEK